MVRASQYRRFVRHRFRAVVVWAAVPLVLLNGRVTASCICADGHVEPFCRVEICSNQTATSTDARDCGCPCCAKDNRDRSSTGCCRGKMACCQQSDKPRSDKSDGAGVSDNSCCTPVVHAQTVPAVVGATKIVDDHRAPAICAAVTPWPCSMNGSSATLHSVLDTGSPPNDLVITLHRLVI